MVIMEATFVFPIMFIILFFMIYMGNAYYVKAQIESVVVEETINAANYCADPLLYKIKNNENSIPECDDTNIWPYRSFSSAGEDAKKICSTNISKRIDNKSSIFFQNMNPNISKLNIQYNNYLIHSSISTDIICDIRFPIKMLGENTPPIATIKTRAECPVNNTIDFIRNTDLVIDMMEGSKYGDNIKGAFSKVKTFLKNFSGKE